MVEGGGNRQRTIIKQQRSNTTTQSGTNRLTASTAPTLMNDK